MTARSNSATTIKTLFALSANTCPLSPTKSARVGEIGTDFARGSIGSEVNRPDVKRPAPVKSEFESIVHPSGAAAGRTGLRKHLLCPCDRVAGP